MLTNGIETSPVSAMGSYCEAEPCKVKAKDMTDTFLIELFRHKAWCNVQLVEALRKAPGDLDRAQMAVVRFTLDHTLRVDRAFRARLSDTDHGLSSVVAKELPDLDILAEALSEIDTWYLDYVRRVSPSDLETTVNFTFISDGDQGHMTKKDILAHVITHGASHRGAIGKMLEAMKVQGAPDMVTTFLRLRNSTR